MSARTSIITALTDKLKLINGTGVYSVNISGNAYPILKFWNEVNDFPSIYSTPGTEIREYLPGGFKWGYLNCCIKVYCYGETAQSQLEDLLGDIEKCIDANRVLIYDSPKETTEIEIQSITTDEGLLAPYAVGEITAQVRYQVM